MRLLIAIGLAVLSFGAATQPYPAKPVRILVPFPPGGTADLLTRLTAEKMSARPEPFGPPSGSGIDALRASVVGLPAVLSAAPAGIAPPVARARISAPIEMTLDAMSSASGSSDPGTAIESGAVPTPAARVPW